MGCQKLGMIIEKKCSVFFSFYIVQKNGMSHPGQPTNLLCPFLVPQCSTYLPTQNRDVINGCSLIRIHIVIQHLLKLANL